jgi:hypothetical protein
MYRLTIADQPSGVTEEAAEGIACAVEEFSTNRTARLHASAIKKRKAAHGEAQKKRGCMPRFH